MSRHSLRIAALLLVLLPAALAAASDGVHEINQTCALQTGCFPGDLPGFPVTIKASGSYQLTGNLTYSASLGPPTEDFVEILADRVTLRLNGFEIRCSYPLTGAPCARGAQVGIDISGDRVRVEDGFITGMPGAGIAGYSVDDVAVERIHAVENGGTGIHLSGRNGAVRNCHAALNGSSGIFNGSSAPAEGTLTEGNVVRENGGDGLVGSGMMRNNVSVENEGRGLSTSSALVEGNTVRSNGDDGISVAGSSLVVDNVIVANGGYGAQGLSAFSYRGNVISGNTLGTVFVSGGGALDTGGNACDGSLVCP
jgi:parallel beta-helix repeat protein